MSSLIQEQHYITFSSDDAAHLPVKVLLKDPPKITVSGSKWETVDRIRRTGMTLWRGRDPVEQTISVLFDGWSDASDVTFDMLNLDRMSRPTPDGDQPPVVHMDGATFRRDIDDWIIVDIAWGDDVIRDIVDGSPVVLRADAVVTLREYLPPDRLKLPGTQDTTTTKAKVKPRPKSQFYTTKKGDTLKTIAKAQYGDYSKWRDIAKANNIRDPDHLKPNVRLRLP